MMARLLGLARVLGWAAGLGLVGFLAGFYGPLVLTPDANQGPLLGYLITGPAGVVVGAAVGLWREARRWAARRRRVR
jgi:hypothetical protein